jgi:hypothetical protein
MSSTFIDGIRANIKYLEEYKRNAYCYKRLLQLPIEISLGMLASTHHSIVDSIGGSIATLSQALDIQILCFASVAYRIVTVDKLVIGCYN